MAVLLPVKTQGSRMQGEPDRTKSAAKSVMSIVIELKPLPIEIVSGTNGTTCEAFDVTWLSGV
jgi:hypothetical protein